MAERARSHRGGFCQVDARRERVLLAVGARRRGGPLRALRFLRKLSLITLAIFGPLAAALLAIAVGKLHRDSHRDYRTGTSHH
jgi:hypothetical protein